jgi:ectoine hydroxylase-related dioxygenase (phytanoyl-CoA dioxygenase family)
MNDPHPDPALLDDHADRIRREGCTVIERLIDADAAAALRDALDRTAREQGFGHAKTSFEGFRTLRINNLLVHDDLFWQVPLNATVLGIAERMLDRELLLHSFCSLVLGPGQPAQPIHEDTQLIPLPRPHMPIVINAIWALSEFREDNGETRFVPRSHRLDHSPQYGRTDIDCEVATMPVGSVLLFDSALWHGGGANDSDADRYAFSCSYCAGWMRQQENYQLGIPRETAARFPRRLQELCGYGVYKGQFGHIDNRDPIELLGQPRGRRMVWEATDVKLQRDRAHDGERARSSQLHGHEDLRLLALHQQRHAAPRAGDERPELLDAGDRRAVAGQDHIARRSPARAAAPLACSTTSP